MDADPLDRLAALADPGRRAVYRFVVEQATGADRNQVATALELSRSLAAYHLDRLVDEGLLSARFEHRGTRRGPGSGRPSKVYERAADEVEISLPPRDYRVAAEVMAEALDALGSEAAGAVQDAALRQGRGLREAGSHPSSWGPTDLHDAAQRLEGCGYEPYLRDDCLRLRNCPFDAIAREHRDLVCSMNLALLDGFLVDGSMSEVQLALEPAEGECCVTIRTVT